MRRRRGDFRIGPSGGKREDRVIRIVEGMDDEVRRAGMIRVLLKHVQRDGCGERLAPESLVAGTHRPQK